MANNDERFASDEEWDIAESMLSVLPEDKKNGHKILRLRRGNKYHFYIEPNGL